MIPTVRSLMRSAAAAGSRFNVVGSTSAKATRPPARSTPSAVAKNPKAGTMTSAPAARRAQRDGQRMSRCPPPHSRRRRDTRRRPARAPPPPGRERRRWRRGSSASGGRAPRRSGAHRFEVEHGDLHGDSSDSGKRFQGVAYSVRRSPAIATLLGHRGQDRAQQPWISAGQRRVPTRPRRQVVRPSLGQETPHSPAARRSGLAASPHPLAAPRG